MITKLKQRVVHTMHERVKTARRSSYFRGRRAGLRSGYSMAMSEVSTEPRWTTFMRLICKIF